jgi:hypothetical protein
MQLEKVQTEILRMLYEAYKANPNHIYDINSITTKYAIDAREMAYRLKSFRLVRDVIFYPSSGAHCSITMLGIYQIDPLYIDTKTRDVIDGLAKANGLGNIVEYLNTDTLHYQFALDLADYLQDLDYLKVRLQNFSRNAIICELTLKGKSEFENRSTFKK